MDGASDIDATADWCMNGSLPACFNACSVLLSNRLNDIQSQSSALVAENSVVFHHFMINLRIFNRPFLSSFPHSLGWLYSLSPGALIVVLAFPSTAFLLFDLCAFDPWLAGHSWLFFGVNTWSHLIRYKHLLPGSALLTRHQSSNLVLSSAVHGVNGPSLLSTHGHKL